MTLDAEDIELIAARVAELLRDQTPAQARLVDAAEVARVLGVDRDWVYAHARELGATRLGGERGRLRFDLARIRRDVACPANIKGTSTSSGRPNRRLGRAEPKRRRGVELIPYEAVRCTGNIGGRTARQRRPTRTPGTTVERGPDAARQ